MKNRLKVARAEMNITQGELAERILKMAKLFRKSVEELFMLEEDD